MKKYLYIFILLVSVALAIGAIVLHKQKGNNQSFSQEAADQSLTSFKEVSKAQVLEVIEQDAEQNKHYSRITATLRIKILNGSEKGQEVEASYDDQLSQPNLQKIKQGDIIIVGKIDSPDGASYVVVDKYRLPTLWWMFGLFVALALLFGRVRGATSIVGLAFSIVVLIYFVAPNVLAGKNPNLVILVGAGMIALISILLAHGFKQRTIIAIISTFITLGLAEGLAYVFVNSAKLLGNSSQDALYLQQGLLGGINLQGILLGGIIIGTLGVLNDITTAQAATVEEIHNTNTNLGFKVLFQKASSVGREHIASLINTLVLVYAGASLPLFLLLTLNKSQPLWALINSESFAEEIVRTLIGSIALILAVPITTALAAYYFSQKR
jgi:uncharacterized membrane protein